MPVINEPPTTGRYDVLPILKKFLNELPTIFVGVWAVLRVFGVEVDDQEAIVEAAEGVLGGAIWLLIRLNTDGPATTYEKKKAEKLARRAEGSE